eukprot:148233-Pelagomonas_calceolata.AAC.1
MLKTQAQQEESLEVQFRSVNCFKTILLVLTPGLAIIQTPRPTRMKAPAIHCIHPNNGVYKCIP